MGIRRGGGGGGGKHHSISDRILRRHIEATGRENFSTVEQLVDHLRSSYPPYARYKLQPFTKQVERLAMVSSRSNAAALEDSNDDGCDTTNVIKRRKVGNEEEKLEAEHSRNNGCSSSSAASVIYSDGGGDSSDEEASVSDDGETLEYSSVMRRNSKRLGEKEAVELEVVNNKGENLMYKDSNLGDISCRKKLNGPMFKDFGGISGVIEDLKVDVIVPLLYPQLRHFGVEPMAGVLLHGPPGCGKTRLAQAIANEAGVSFYPICATELVSGVSGESEESIRKLFSKAYSTAPSIVFIDEIDAIASKRDDLQRGMEKRIVMQLLASMDKFHVPVKRAGDEEGAESSDCGPGNVLVIGATNRPDALDPALRRNGRFDCEIALGPPDEAGRNEILSVLIQNLRVERAFDILKIAKLTPGFSGADLTELARKAANIAMRRNLVVKKVELSKEKHSKDWFLRLGPWLDEDLKNLGNEEMKNFSITTADFEEAAKKVQTSSSREGFSDIPDETWDDVGGHHLLRQEFHSHIIRPIKFPRVCEKSGVNLATGFLLYGPPGCGKTLIAKALANQAGAKFIYIKGPELLSKYVGESESGVRKLFNRARTSSPCIIFFDEVDALTNKGGEEAGVVQRFLKQLLVELDGSEQRRGVHVIGATNSPWVMDEALLRPGRFGKHIYVTLPTPDERGMILKAHARKMPIDPDMDLVSFGKDSRCDKLSGADLKNLMHVAALAALKDKTDVDLAAQEKEMSLTDGNSSLPWTIKYSHIRRASREIRPSVSDEQLREYEKFKARSRSISGGEV